MKKKLLVAISLLFYSFCFSQELLVQSNSKGLFLNHTVSAKESFYSVGRMYGSAPRDIAAFNGIDLEKGLITGQTIMIPLNATNFSQADQKGVPVYYLVGQKEGLYRVSLKNNKVLMANLRKWNKLATDNIATGQKLVIGYLNVATAPTTGEVAKTETAPPAVETGKVATEAAKQTPQPAAPVAEKKPEPVTEIKREEPKPNATTTARQTAISGAGFFKTQFDLQSRNNSANKDQTATTGTFKTASGWQDSKYYALMDNVEPGTIIRVINPSNNKSIYAKVLGEMSGIRQNQGLDLRLSNAAASILEVSDTDKFTVRVSY